MSASRKKSEYISVGSENHNNPQNTKSEHGSFYEVHLNRNGHFVGQEQGLVRMLPKYCHIMTDTVIPIL